VSKHEEAKAGLKSLVVVVRAAKACGVYDDFAETLQQLQTAFENHSDEEVDQWTE
jgi:phage tail tape-measure protein